MQTDEGKNLGQIIGLSIMGLMMLALIAGQVSRPDFLSTGKNSMHAASVAAEQASAPVARP